MNRVDYEKFWKGYWNDTTVYGPACRHRRRIVRKLLASIPHQNVLDLGCGDGSFVAESSKLLNATFEGSDISEAALEIARKNVPGIRFYKLDLMAGAPDHKYDAIVLSEVLEHIEDDEHVLKTIAPFTRHVVISVPGGSAHKVDRRYGHFRNYTGNLLQEKLERCGFDVVRYFRWGFPLYDLQQFLAYQEGEWGSKTMSEGRYGPGRRIISHLVYGLYFLQFLPMGQQVFAIGKSKSFPET
ncbi:MAG TPA: class I SAM-dependent methyltransferase [Kiritimatiellia bacterium]|nr:class I SAM-dependent methyltransferase [Kiritimatiellia bacterium]